MNRAYNYKERLVMESSGPTMSVCSGDGSSRAPRMCTWARFWNHPIRKKCHKLFTVYLDSVDKQNSTKDVRVGDES